eukprot:s2534_g9.t1
MFHQHHLFEVPVDSRCRWVPLWDLRIRSLGRFPLFLVSGKVRLPSPPDLSAKYSFEATITIQQLRS